MEISSRVLFSGHEAPVYSLEGDSGGEVFYSGGGDRVVSKWNIHLPDSVKGIIQTPSTIYSIKLLSDKGIMLIGCSDGSIHIVDLEKGKEKRFIQHHKQGVFDFEVFIEQNRLFSSSADGSFSVWQLDDFKLLQSRNVCEGKIRSLSLNNDRSKLAVACGDGMIRIFDPMSLDLITEIPAHTSSVNVVCWHPSEDLLLSGGHDAHLNIWDALSYRSLDKIPAHNYAIYSMDFSPDAKYFATASRDKTIKLWKSADMKILQRLDAEKHEGHKFSVNKMLWLSNEELLSAGDDRNILLWKLNPDS